MPQAYDLTHATMTCPCGGSRVHTGEVKTSYPSGHIFRCERCGVRGGHYGVYGRAPDGKWDDTVTVLYDDLKEAFENA